MSTSSTSTLGIRPGPAAATNRSTQEIETDQEKLWELGARLANSYSDALTVINGHATLLLGRQDLGPETRQQASAIYRAGEQAARLTQQLIIIGGRRPLRIEAVDLRRLVDDATLTIQTLLGAERTLEIDLAGGDAVAADPEMLEHLMVCLAANAAEALPPGGRLSITSEIQTFTESAAPAQAENPSGKFVCLVFRDTGCGMAPEILARAFEPFFTTKKIGQATSGLGLAVVRSIVRDSRGWITLDSEPSRGTTVKIFLPSAPVVDRGVSAAAEAPAARQGKASILLVDDEPALRELTAMVLQSQGFRVLQAANGSEALEVWKWHAPRIDLLFTDLVMPGNFSGLDLAEKFQAEKPTLKIICMTGNLDHLPRQGTAELANIRYLQKPCSPLDMNNALTALLEPTSRSASPVTSPPSRPTEARRPSDEHNA